MRVKELIRQLQEADPTGEEEACVGNIDIHFIENLPAYYDGSFQILHRDPSRTGRCYDICGGEFRREGRKIQIHILSLRDIIWEDPKVPIVNPDYRIQEWRKEASEE